jgi:ketosteroid isomerase-like protein
MATKSDPAFGTRQVKDIVPEIESIFAEYNEAINRRDAEAIYQSFDGLPYAEFAQSGNLVVRTSRDELVGQYQAAFDEFETTGWSHTQFFDVSVVPLSDNVAVLAATCDRYHKDGSVLVAGKKVMYVFRRFDGAWRIAAYTYLADGFPNVTSDATDAAGT